MIRSGSIACGFSLLFLGGSALAQVTQRASLTWLGAQSAGASQNASLSADGRWVAFVGGSDDLFLGDVNGFADVFVRDRLYGVNYLASRTFLGTGVNGVSHRPSMTPDGFFVAFESGADNIVGGDTNSAQDIFIRDLVNSYTERLSVSTAGVQGNGNSHTPSITTDGRFVAFWSDSSNLVAGDTNMAPDCFVRDRQLNTTERISVDSNGFQGTGLSEDPCISPDGRYVVFFSAATNLVAGDTNGVWDIFVRDRQLGLTERISVDSTGAQANGQSLNNSEGISADGRYVVFQSDATNLVAGDTNAKMDIFVRDRQLGLTERVSISTAGVQANNFCVAPSMSADGRYVAFDSASSNLIFGDPYAGWSVFVRDRQAGLTERVSTSSAGVEPNGVVSSTSISSDGRCVAFQTNASNLVPGDTNGQMDVFVHDRLGGAISTTICNPGVGGVVMLCPCSNPPSGGGGCDNSAATGGAILSAAGDTHLTSDSLVFTTSGQVPTTASLLVQGTAVVAPGVAYFQGVRCIAGTLRRLAVKAAIGGSITVPDFVAGEPTISARSATLGDTIPAGQSRWYSVFYRDPIVLGGCAPTSTLNVTQTAEIVWLP